MRRERREVAASGLELRTLSGPELSDRDWEAIALFVFYAGLTAYLVPHQALGADMILSVMELMPNALLSLGAQAASGTMNSIVTNVPGPQFPLYVLGSEMLAMYPQVPLLANVGLGIALVSYNGRICWGFNADPGLVPDLPDFVALVPRAFERLAEAADVKLSPPAVDEAR